MSGFWLTLNTVTAILPPLLASEAGLSSTETTIVLSVAYLMLAGGYISAGVLSQKVGRRPFLAVTGGARPSSARSSTTGC